MEQSKVSTTNGKVLPSATADLRLETDELNALSPPPVSRLFDLGQLDVSWDEEEKTLWSFMTPEGRPSFNLQMLGDFDIWQSEIARIFGTGGAPLDYLVLGSRFPGVWNFGGDLGLFAKYIRSGNRDGLVEYGERCVAILHNNLGGLGLPITTIGLIQGQALGGGFEALLSFNVLIAEKSARFGLPEVAFGLFPGMGAHSLLVRRLGAAQAERMILSGKTYSADEMYDLGLVHKVVKDGEGEQAVADYIRVNGRRQAGNSAIFAATRKVQPIALEELNAIVGLWADTALRLRDKDLKLMERLVSAQAKLSSKISEG